MSRGERVAVSGNISISMRDNYEIHGVSEYYTKVGATYRNPHYPGIRLCMFDLLNRWWNKEREDFVSRAPEVVLFDLACGKYCFTAVRVIFDIDQSGEATLAFTEWCNTGKRLYRENASHTENTSKDAIPRRKPLIEPVPLDASFPKPSIIAADPFTSQAYKERTSYPCASLSFDEVAEGALPQQSVNIVDRTIREFPWPITDSSLQGQDVADCPRPKAREDLNTTEMVVCSFALHLVEDSSNLFTLLWQLSLNARWLVVLAPHKRPEIKDGWGWHKWDVDTWTVSASTSNSGELLHERVHCRIYRSTNV